MLQVSFSSTIPHPSKEFLKSHLFSSIGMELLEINNPTILVCRLPNGEVRSFVTTQSGFLLEHEENFLWDIYFSFIERRGGSLAFKVPSNLPVVTDESSFLFANYSANFTHFLFDFWALLARIVSSGSLQDLIPNEIPIFERPVSWQNQYFDLIRPFRPSYFHNLFEEFNSMAFYFCPSKVVLPVFDNKPLSFLFARQYLHEIDSKNQLCSGVSPLSGRIILLTRNDSRRARIKNIDEIEELVASMGGHVIDPIKYSVSERIHLFSRPSVFIAENSGCMNVALFGNSHSQLISLVEPSMLSSTELLVAGWTYLLGFSNRTDYVVGSDLEPLRGSPMGASSFSLSQIQSLINAKLDIIAS